MAKQTFTTGQVLTASQMTSLQQTSMGGGSTTAKVASYSLVAADAGTVVQMNSASATTITVNTGLFAAGDTVAIQNVGAGVCTITAGSATVNTSSTLSLKQYDAGSLYFNSTSAAIFFASDAADSPLTTKGDLFTYSTSDTRLAVGTNDYFLQAASGQTTGLQWGGTFTTYTPVLYQGATIATSTAQGRYIKIGKFIHGSVFIVANGAGTASNKVYVTIPVAAQTSNVFLSAGGATLYDASTALVYPSQVTVEDATNFSFPISSGSASNGLQYLGNNLFTAAIAAADQIGFRFSYEVA